MQSLPLKLWLQTYHKVCIVLFYTCMYILCTVTFYTSSAQTPAHGPYPARNESPSGLQSPTGKFEI